MPRGFYLFDLSRANSSLKLIVDLSLELASQLIITAILHNPSPYSLFFTSINMVGKLKQSKVVNKAKAIKVTKAAVPEQIVAPVVVEDEDQDVSSDDDDEEDEMDGVTEEGMEKLMALLGEEGISDFDRAQLEEMEDNEDDEDEEEDEEDEEVDEDGLPLDDESDDDEEMDDEEEIEEEDQVEGEEQDIALDDLESDLSVDEDAVPVRKVTINNRVSLETLQMIREENFTDEPLLESRIDCHAIPPRAT